MYIQGKWYIRYNTYSILMLASKQKCTDIFETIRNQCTTTVDKGHNSQQVTKVSHIQIVQLSGLAQSLKPK